MKALRIICLLLLVSILLPLPTFAQETAKKVDATLLFHVPETNYWSTSAARIASNQTVRIRVVVLNTSNQTLRDLRIEELVPAPLRLQGLSVQAIDSINAGAEKFVEYAITYDSDRFGVTQAACGNTTTIVKSDTEILDTESVSICYGSQSSVLGAITENPQTAVEGYQIFGFAAVLLGMGNLFFAYITAKNSHFT